LTHNQLNGRILEDFEGENSSLTALYLGMANNLTFQTVLVPALISLVLYVALTYAILPFIRRHRQRYSQYLPLTQISNHTSSLRERLSDALVNFLLPSSWRRGPGAAGGQYGNGDSDGSLFDEEEGEGMVGFEIDSARREALDRRRSSGGDEQRRLSRELEEGFRDESDDEEHEDESVLRTQQPA
jgi:hypothetical protein